MRNVELVERMQSRLRSVLDNMLSQAHPDKAGLFLELLRKIPDLRTLNTLHSEKLLAFKMTEQQQQQHYQHQTGNASPPWVQHNSRDSYDEEVDGAKSPMGSSVSSSGESACSSHEAMSDLPLLAAVAVGSAIHHHHHHHHHHRRRPRGQTSSQSENGSSVSSDGEEMMDGQSSTTSTSSRMLRIVESPASSASSSSSIILPGTMTSSGSVNSGCPYGKMRKLADSPDDSGIESGVDRYEKLSTASRSTNTSLCSSPRSSLEDKVKEVDEMQQHHHHHVAVAAAAGPATTPLSRNPASSSSSVDDMPVLKRVLQAPPLFDTNSLMDEAYKPHKKFRALTLQRKGSAEPDVPTRAPVLVCSPPRSSPTTMSGSPTTTSTTTSSSTSVLSAALSSPPGTSSSSSAYSALCSALTSSSPASSLTSTHSTLARSLMEGPKLSLVNAEQQRRADLIVANIMKGTVSSSPSPPPPQRTVLTQGPLYVPSSSANNNNNNSSTSNNNNGYYHNQQPAQSAQPVGGAENAQPLNLSLKSPSSSPARSTTPVTTAAAHYFPLHA